MRLSAAQRMFIVRDQIVSPTLFNAGLNGWLAWLVFRHQAFVPMNGTVGIVSDALATAVMLPLMTCLFATPFIRWAVRLGKVEALRADDATLDRLLRLPTSAFKRGIVLAAPCLLCLAPIVLAALWLAGVDELPVMTFVVVKAIYAGVIAGVVSPVIALYALATTTSVRDPESLVAG
jgi:hypothetical protein